MVGMLMRDQDGIDLREVLADQREAPAQLLHTQAGVEQNARAAGGEEGGIAGAAAGENAERDLRQTSRIQRGWSKQKPLIVFFNCPMHAAKIS